MDARTLLREDWGRAVRDPIDLLRLGLVATALGVAADGGHWTNLAVSSAAAVAVRLARLPRPYDLAFVLAMGLTGCGDAFGAYETWSNFDSVVHFFVPLLVSPVLYILLARGEVLPDPEAGRSERHHLVGVFVVTLALGLAVGALWEIFEYASDHAFASKLQHGQADTIGDLVADGCGAGVGAVLLVVWTVFGWSSARRVSPR